MNRVVLMVITTLDSGGSEWQLAATSRGLRDAGWQVEVCALKPGGTVRARLEGEGFSVYAPRRGGWRGILEAWTLCRRLIQSLKPDIVHAWLPLAGAVAALALPRRSPCRLILSKRALGRHQDRFPGWVAVDRFADARAHGILANSNAVRSDVCRREIQEAGKVEVIHNGLDTARFAAAATRRADLRREWKLEGQTVIVCVGNMIPYKGHADLLRALSALDRAGWVCLIVGQDRGAQFELEEECRRRSLQASVRFMGQRDDVPDLLALSDIFVLPSHEEGFSNALLEAMASGLAIVASDVGGNREALDDGRCGELFEARNISALQEKLELYLDDQQLRARRGEGAKARAVAEYGMERYLARTLEYYRKVLG